jgi:hypothetical protein
VRLVAEMGVIIFSVLLALLVNEWRQAQTRNATVKTVLEAVRAEAEANRAQLAGALAYHRDLIAKLQSGGLEMARIDIQQARLDTTSDAAFARTLSAAARAAGSPLRGDFIAERLPTGEWRIDHDTGHLLVAVDGQSAVVRGIGNITLNMPFLLDYAWETAQLTQAAAHIDPAIIAGLARIRQLQRNLDMTISRLLDILYGTSAGGEIIPAMHDLISFERDLLEAYDRLLDAL